MGLPRDYVDPVELFESVQRNINILEDKLSRKNRRGNRIYTLTGLLEYEDGSGFRGMSGTGRGNEMHYYYRNDKNDFSIDATAIENAIINALRIYENDPKMIQYVVEAQKSQFSKLSYGQREISGQSLKHKRELENISKMKELRDQGFSYWKIANIFNAMEIPTKNRKGKWQAATVMKILKAQQPRISDQISPGSS